MTKVVILVTKGDWGNMTVMSLVASGAIANDLDTSIFFMEDSVWALRKEQIGKDTELHSHFPEVVQKFTAAQNAGKLTPWWELLPDLKDLGEVNIIACAQALDVMELTKEDLADFVDDIAGVTTFMELVQNADKVISL